MIGQGATGTTDNTVLLGNGSITNWLPTDTNEVDLGSSTKEMKDIYVDGVAYTDAIGFGTVAMTLPTADGSANQVLKTDGSGNLGWTAAGGGGAIDGLSDAKLEGTDFTGSMILGHQTTGTLDAAEKNTGVGIGSLDAITSGDGNTAIGKNALTSQTTGHGNTASGNSSLQFNTTGGYNTASGAFALNANTTGSNNTALGSDAGDVITTGSNNITIGAEADPSANNATNQIVIGQGATGTTDNTVLLGNGSITNWLPTDTNEVDLGSSTKEMKDIYVDGVAYTDVHMSQDGQATVYTGGLVLEGATVNAHETTLGVVDPTADATLNLPAMGAGTYYVPVLAAASTTSITSTPAELNIMDGVNSTAAELNIMDGGTSATSTTIADADRVVLNDNGTMVQVAVTDLSTYSRRSKRNRRSFRC